MKLVKENIQFTRGGDPKEAMDIGLPKLYLDPTPSDIPGLVPTYMFKWKGNLYDVKVKDATEDKDFLETKIETDIPEELLTIRIDYLGSQEFYEEYERYENRQRLYHFISKKDKIKSEDDLINVIKEIIKYLEENS